MESSWWHRLIWALVVLALASGCSAQSYLDSNIEDEIGLNTSQVLRLRGYLATDHTVLSQDGFAVNLVEAENPLVDYSSPYVARKEPVLFIHGTLFNATCFITDTPAPASPKDFSRYNASRMSHAGLESLYAGNPNSLSLVLILLDFGHKVYLLNRRNTIASQRAYAMANNMTYTENAPNNGSAAAAAALLDPAGLTDPNNAFTSYFASLAATVDSPRWNYSVDEAAQYDLPPVVDLILRLTGFRTLVAVGWSSGGQIIEMGLATQPDLNQKSKFKLVELHGRCSSQTSNCSSSTSSIIVSKSLLWSPSLYLGPTFQDSLFYVLTQPLTNTYVGPILPQFFNDIISNLAARFCSNEATQQTICQGVIDFIGGYGDGTQRLVSDGSSANCKDFQ